MEEAWLFLMAACILEPVWVVCLERSDNLKNIGWVVIILGGFFQVGWSVGLDYTDGMTNLF